MLGEVERLGRTLTGRPHFARVLIDKGYVTSFDEAFRRYLGESAPSYVERFAPYVAGGHPTGDRWLEGCRFWRIPFVWVSAIWRPKRNSLAACATRDCAASRYFIPIIAPPIWNATPASRVSIISPFPAARTFMASVKPQISLGTGHNGNLNIPKSVLDSLRAVCG